MDHRPQNHEEKDMKDDECDYHVGRPNIEHESEDESVVIEANEGDDPHKVYVDEFAQGNISKHCCLNLYC